MKCMHTIQVNPSYATQHALALKLSHIINYYKPLIFFYPCSFSFCLWYFLAHPLLISYCSFSPSSSSCKVRVRAAGHALFYQYGVCATNITGRSRRLFQQLSTFASSSQLSCHGCHGRSSWRVRPCSWPVNASSMLTCTCGLHHVHAAAGQPAGKVLVEQATAAAAASWHMQAIDDATGDDDGQIMDHKLTSWRRRLPLSTCLHLHPLRPSLPEC